MEITREYLEQRLADLRFQEANALATTHAIRGAIQEVNFHLQELEKEEEKPDEE